MGLVDDLLVGARRGAVAPQPTGKFGYRMSNPHNGNKMPSALSTLRLVALALSSLSTITWASTLPKGVVDVLPAECRQPLTQAYTFTEHRLSAGKNARLWIVACGTGAYQSAFALVRSSPESGYRSLLFAERRNGSWTGTDRLYDPVYNEKTGDLRDHYKLIGTGQCGGERRWRWVDENFQLLEYREQQDCSSQAKGSYPQVFPQTAP
ncbi:DUF1176 domain-containing protein [Pseudomonas syringae]|uniref:DUF1176 domain-containing protein n=1 Tax=Pseudomonas syringae TaxID=317 RepID=UPI0013655C80